MSQLNLLHRLLYCTFTLQSSHIFIHPGQQSQQLAPPDSTRHQILMCIGKLTESQLNLTHGTEQQKMNENYNQKTALYRGHENRLQCSTIVNDRVRLMSFCRTRDQFTVADAMVFCSYAGYIQQS